MKPFTIITSASTIAALFLATTAAAHRQWLLPSTSILSGKDQWISVEAAISNDLFFPNHHAMALDRIEAIGPDGSSLEFQSATEGEIRSSFELLLKDEGTYRIGSASDRLSASWTEAGERKRWRGSRETLREEGILEKPGARIGDYSSRVEVYVTCGAPSREVVAPTGQGLELEYISHPNDLYVGEKARFRLLLDGKGVADSAVTVVKGNDRFRNKVGEMTATTDAEGNFEINWPETGRFWLNASAELPESEFEGVPLRRRAAYSVTLEVLPD